MRTITTLRLWVLAVATVVLVIACDRVPLTSPTGSTISISAAHSVLPVGGQTTVTAIVTESAGTPVNNGTSVSFQTTMGSLNPPEVRTMNGVATTTFLAGSSSGTATIHAFSGGARTGTASGNASSGSPVTIRIGAAAASGNISVSAAPSSVSQSGGTVTVSAVVFDADNNPLPGVTVQFVTSTGSLSATSANTDSSGIARTQLTTTQTATVTALAGAAKGEVRVEVSAAPPAEIRIAPEPAVVGAPVAITVSSNGSAGARQVQSITVDFGDGTSETRANTSSAAFTHTYGREGAVTVSARVVDVAGNTGSTSRALIINRSTPSVTVTPSDSTPQVNQQIGFTVAAQPGVAGGPPIASWVAFIDGTQVAAGAGGNGAFLHTFTSTGAKLVVVEARDSAGTVGQTQQFLTVLP